MNSITWSLDDFAEPTVTDGMEIRLSLDGDRVLLIFPWHTPPTMTGDGVKMLQTMGWKYTHELGNLNPYTVVGADTDDSDYVLMGVS